MSTATQRTLFFQIKNIIFYWQDYSLRTIVHCGSPGLHPCLEHEQVQEVVNLTTCRVSTKIFTILIINKSLCFCFLSRLPTQFLTQSCFHEYYSILIFLTEVPYQHPYFPEDGKTRLDPHRSHFLIPCKQRDYICQPPLQLGQGQNANETWVDIRYVFF